MVISTKKSGDNRRLLYDQRSVINDRCNYLRKIRKFREDGYEIVYLDETWVNQNHATDYMWLPVDGSDAPKIPSEKGKRLIVLHAGNREEGLIDRCDLVFLAKAKDGDYHQEMNGPIFLNWFENQLMPALKSPSVIVLDNASYHNIKTEETVVPNFNQRKAVLQDYLSKHNIPFQPLETKKQLYEKIKFKKLLSVFSSPDPKGHVRYCHHLASVVRPSSVVRRPSVNFSYFNLLLWNNWTKWNQIWQKASI